MTTSFPIVNPRLLVQLLLEHRVRWLGPTIGLSVLALLFAIVKSNSWEASQAHTLREEAIGSLRAGRFADADAMKHAQETLLEIARSEAVVRGALKQVGTSRGGEWPGGEPSQQDIEAAQRVISVKPPNGAEFGRTEVFYLVVRDSRKARAEALCAAVSDNLEAQLRNIRRKKAESLVNELKQTADLARGELNSITAKVSSIEKQVGSDLGELRLLSQPSGESNLRATLVAAKNDLRSAELSKRTKEELMSSLREAQKDPNKLVATPNELLDSQPAVRKLKEGLLDAQLLCSQLAAQMTPEHPRVQACIVTQTEIKARIYSELETALRGLQAEIDTNQARTQSLEQQVAEINGRLSKLAQLRAEYSNLTSEVDRRNEIVKKSEESLADARASAAASETASLLTRLSDPTTGGNPQGPGRTTIVAAGMVGGLFTGLAVMFLTVPLTGVLGGTANPNPAPVAPTPPAGVTITPLADKKKSAAKVPAQKQEPTPPKPAIEKAPDVAAAKPLPAIDTKAPVEPEVRSETPVAHTSGSLNTTQAKPETTEAPNVVRPRALERLAAAISASHGEATDPAPAAVDLTQAGVVINTYTGPLKIAAPPVVEKATKVASSVATSVTSMSLAPASVAVASPTTPEPQPAKPSTSAAVPESRSPKATPASRTGELPADVREKLAKLLAPKAKL